MKTSALDIAVGIVLGQFFSSSIVAIGNEILKCENTYPFLFDFVAKFFGLIILASGLSFPFIAYYTLRDR